MSSVWAVFMASVQSGLLKQQLLLTAWEDWWLSNVVNTYKCTLSTADRHALTHILSITQGTRPWSSCLRLIWNLQLVKKKMIRNWRSFWHCRQRAQGLELKFELQDSNSDATLPSWVSLLPCWSLRRHKMEGRITSPLVPGSQVSSDTVRMDIFPSYQEGPPLCCWLEAVHEFELPLSFHSATDATGLDNGQVNSQNR